jgi:hypothetical protein
MDVANPAWHPESNQMHNVFWLNDGKWKGGVFGYLNIRGPGKNRLIARHDTDPVNNNWLDINVRFNMQINKKYFIRYVYGQNANFVEVDGVRYDLPQGARPVMRRGPEPFFMRIGFHEEETGPERPSYGWLYENIEVEFVE